MSDPRDTSPSEEPRVGELLARASAPDASEELDPLTIAQLAAWFGPPEPGVGPAGPAPEPARTPDAATRRARALAAVDPRFVAAHRARWSRGEALLHVTAPPWRPRRPASKFDLAVWNLHLGDPPRETERPEDIGDTLKDPTPQAILRDLHRVDQPWLKRLLPTDLGVDVAGLDTRAKIDAVLAINYVVRVDDEPIPARIMAEASADLRARLAQSWEDSYVPPEDRVGPASYVPTAENMKWFGSMGFDPDL